jgi:hypothetical protein
MFRFPSLREVVLVVDGDMVGRGDWEYDLRSAEGRKLCVADLRALFGAVGGSGGGEGLGGRVPEIKFRDSGEDILGS